MDFEQSLKVLEVTMDFVSDDDECDAVETELDKLVQALSQAANPSPSNWRKRVQELRKKIEQFRLTRG